MNQMNRISIFVIIAIMAWACSPSKHAAKQQEQGTAKTSVAVMQKNQDSTEYDIVIIDPNFDHWYLLNYSPAKDHSNDYYHQKNIIAVSNWNEYYRTARYSGIIETPVQYYPDVDYGMEVNRKLFWYFKYIRDNFGIRLF